MSATYRIRIRGHLEDRWAERFGGMAIERHADGTTVMFGSVADQPALHGLLELIRNLGLQLLDVNRVETHEGGPPPASRAGPGGRSSGNQQLTRFGIRMFL